MSPLDYNFCCQTVTRYRLEHGGVSRKIFHHAFLQWRWSACRDRTGKTDHMTFLLILPGSSFSLQPGDRVMAGEGPESNDWGRLLPGAVPGLGQIIRVTPCFWGGEQCHLEAEGE